MTGLLDRLQERDPQAIARAISLIEARSPEAGALQRSLASRIGRAYRIGVTGPPGAGKSTLVNRLIEIWRAHGRSVGVLAVDPSSPFTGGAILGDRVRLQDHAADPGVFVRSMATRGRLGGLAEATDAAGDVLDVAGFDIVVAETVGVGQSEVEIVRWADATVIVLVPGAGDDIQALKAGLMEIGDVFAVNKSDLAGAEQLAVTVQAMLALGDRAQAAWQPPVLQVSAASGRNVTALAETLDRFRSEATIAQRRALRRQWQFQRALDAALRRRVEEDPAAARRMTDALEMVRTGSLDPMTAAASVAAQVDDSDGYPLDHVALAMPEASPVLVMLERLFGLRATDPEDVRAQGVRVSFVDTGAARLEVVSPAERGSSIDRFLEKRGGGLHHIALRVANLSAALSRLEGLGVRLIDRAPRPGADGARVAFLHPSSTCGVLIELVERRDTGDAVR